MQSLHSKFNLKVLDTLVEMNYILIMLLYKIYLIYQNYYFQYIKLHRIRTLALGCPKMLPGVANLRQLKRAAKNTVNR